MRPSFYPHSLCLSSAYIFTSCWDKLSHVHLMVCHWLSNQYINWFYSNILRMERECKKPMCMMSQVWSNSSFESYQSLCWQVFIMILLSNATTLTNQMFRHKPYCLCAFSFLGNILAHCAILCSYCRMWQAMQNKTKWMQLTCQLFWPPTSCIWTARLRKWTHQRRSCCRSRQLLWRSWSKVLHW